MNMLGIVVQSYNKISDDNILSTLSFDFFNSDGRVMNFSSDDFEIEEKESKFLKRGSLVLIRFNGEVFVVKKYQNSNNLFEENEQLKDGLSQNLSSLAINIKKRIEKISKQQMNVYGMNEYLIDSFDLFSRQFDEMDLSVEDLSHTIRYR